MITLSIDGREIGAHEGEMILEAARRVRIEIPTLCHHEAIAPYGACRLCMVEVEQRGRTRLVASCLFPVEQGLVVRTSTERVKKVRRGIMELLAARCPDSPEIQELAREMGVSGTRFDPDASRCILCGLCVRACSEISEKDAISFAGRGTKRTVATPFHVPTEECIKCKACVFLCPTRAITFDEGQVVLPK